MTTTLVVCRMKMGCHDKSPSTGRRRFRICSCPCVHAVQGPRTFRLLYNASDSQEGLDSVVDHAGLRICVTLTFVGCRPVGCPCSPPAVICLLQWTVGGTKSMTVFLFRQHLWSVENRQREPPARTSSLQIRIQLIRSDGTHLNDKAALIHTMKAVCTRGTFHPPVCQR